MLLAPKHRNEYFDMESAPPFRGLIPLLRHPWWFRIWTLQESALAQSCELLCGRHRILLDHFLVIKDYDFWKTFPRGRQSGVLFNWQLRRGTSRQFYTPRAGSLGPAGSSSDLHLDKQGILRFLLYTSFTLDATLPVDKVYGLHGLLTLCGLQMDDPDYHLDTASVYEAMVLAYLRTY